MVTPFFFQGKATGAIYGDGTYFARDASYSLNHALPLALGQNQMLVAEVRSKKKKEGGVWGGVESGLSYTR